MKFAFVFPGQGSQSIGMMKGYGESAVIRRTFEEASEILQQDLWRLVAEGPETELNMTINTQPVMLTAGVAVYRAWQESDGPLPAVLAGHSLGEYTALVAAGALSFKDAVSLVRFRAQAMQDAVPEGTGGMVAILGLEDDEIREVCTKAAQGKVLEPANFNSPAQVVIAGHKDAVMRGMELAKTRGAKRAVVLPMSVPSHCSLMKPASEKLKQRLKEFAISAPSIPVVHNADVSVHDSAAKIRDALVSQLHQPVRWVDTIKSLAAMGMTHIVECGPGKVLAGLNKRIDGNLEIVALTDSASLQAAKGILH